jgi:hypothetical protein
MRAQDARFFTELGEQFVVHRRSKYCCRKQAQGSRTAESIEQLNISRAFKNS